MNQSDTNPLARALAALMTGHNANPNTSLRIPLVDSNGNLQPGPTLAELALVLGAQRLRVSPAPNGGVATIQLGIPRAFVMFVWVNSTLTAPPALLMAGRNGAISIMSGNGNIVTEDKPANICVFKENDTDTFITIKNNTTFTISVFCYTILLENY